MGCRVRGNHHGFLAFRLRWNGLDSHEGTALPATPENRRTVEDRARVIDREMRDGSFDYLRWFPHGNLASRFTDAPSEPTRRVVTLRGFFQGWGDDASDSGAIPAEHKQTRPVTLKWALNRASYLRCHVLPVLGTKRLDELLTSDLTYLQQVLRRKHLKPTTIDRIIHSALRGMLRDAGMLGYAVPDLARLYDPRYVSRLAVGALTEVQPFTDTERDAILDGFWKHHRAYYAFVFFQIWTGARPSEAIALRHAHVDLAARRVRIRGSRVLGRDGEPKTGHSRRDVVIHDDLARVLRDILPTHPDPDGFLFTTPDGAPIDQANFLRRAWAPMLRRLGLRPRRFYATRHTYISFMLAAGARPLFVAHQTGTSLKMIEERYGHAQMLPDALDDLIRAGGGENGNLAGTLSVRPSVAGARKRKSPVLSGLSERAGDRDRTDDVQLGKLAFYR